MTHEYYRVGVYEGQRLIAASRATSSLESALEMKLSLRAELRTGLRAALLLCEVDPNPDFALRACDGTASRHASH
jgi:hypothetical protein